MSWETGLYYIPQLSVQDPSNPPQNIGYKHLAYKKRKSYGLVHAANDAHSLPLRIGWPFAPEIHRLALVLVFSEFIKPSLIPMDPF